MTGSTPGLLLSRRTRRHAVLFGLRKRPLIVMLVYLVVAVAVTATFQHVGMIAVAGIVGLGLYGAMREPLRMDRAPWLQRVIQRARVSATTHDGFVPTEATPFPRPVGDVLILGVALEEDA